MGAATAGPRRALVLAGGGARGAFQVGMLDHLVNEADLDFQILRGVSVGALNSAFLAQAPVGGSPADEIWVLLTSRVDPKPDGELPDSAVRPESCDRWHDDGLGTKVSGIAVLKRSLELLMDEIYLGDLDTALDWNMLLGPVEKILAAAAAGPAPPALSGAIDDLRRAVGVVGKRAVTLYLLAPREWYGGQANDEDRDNSAVNFSPAAIARAIAHGREVAANRSLWLRK